MNYRLILSLTLVSFFIFSNAFAGMGPVYQFDGLVKQVDINEGKVLLSVSCSKYGAHIVSCREEAVKRQRILGMLDKMIVSKKNQPIAALLEKISNHFKKELYFDMRIGVDDNKINIKSIQVGDVVQAETLAMHRDDLSQIIKREVNREYKGVINSLYNDIVVIEGDYYNNFIIDNAEIVDENGNIMRIEDISIGKDVFSISGDRKNGIVYASYLKRLGKVSEENEKKDLMCKPGLVEVMNYRSFDDVDVYCTKCGDGVCSSSESIDNCLADCSKNGDSYSASVYFDGYTYNPASGVFYGKTHNDVIRFVKDKDTKMIVQFSMGGEEVHQSIISESEQNFKEFIDDTFGFPRGIDGKIFTMKDGVKAVRVESVSVWAQ